MSRSQKVRFGDEVVVALVKNVVVHPDHRVTGEIKRNRQLVPVYRSTRQKIWTAA